MAKITYSNKAVEDLSFIWNYTASAWSAKKADEYYNDLIKMIQRIAESPFTIGKKYQNISDNLFGIKSGRHIIFYSYWDEDNIKVIRILHGSMDLSRHLTM